MNALTQKQFVDQYGRTQSTMGYNSSSKPPVYQVESQGDTIFVRYADATPCAVRRIQTIGSVTTIGVAWGDWANRANLSYTAPGTYPKEVANEDHV